MGIPWHEQELGISLAQFLFEFRQGIIMQILETGRFDRRDMDHGSVRYQSAFSNKRVKIAGARLGCETPDDYDAAFATVLRTAFPEVTFPGQQTALAMEEIGAR